jgi:hypothetical protein
MANERTGAVLQRRTAEGTGGPPRVGHAARGDRNEAAADGRQQVCGTGIQASVADDLARIVDASGLEDRLGRVNSQGIEIVHLAAAVKKGPRRAEGRHRIADDLALVVDRSGQTDGVPGESAEARHHTIAIQEGLRIPQRVSRIADHLPLVVYRRGRTIAIAGKRAEAGHETATEQNRFGIAHGP